MRNTKQVLAVIAVCALTPTLSGCLAAAAIPMLMTTAAGGFLAFKTVQTTVGGGEVRIAFGDGKKDQKPAPLTTAKDIAVWPGDEMEVAFSEKMTAAGVQVRSPAQVSATLTKLGKSKELKQLTQAEQLAAFADVCTATSAQQVAYANQTGFKANDSMLSASRPSLQASGDLGVFACRERAIVWRDKFTIIVTIGSKETDAQEINRIAGGAWADWILLARQTV